MKMGELYGIFVKLSSLLFPEPKNREIKGTKSLLEIEFEKEYGISLVQLKQTAKFFTVVYLAMVILLIRSFKFSFSSSCLLLLLGLYGYYLLSMYPIDKIELKISRLDSLLYFIKMDVDLILKLNQSKEEPILNLIDLLETSYLDLSEPLKEVKKNIIRGEDIESSLNKIKIASKKIQAFFSNLILYISDSRYLQFNQGTINELEYKTFSKGLETRLSVLFFIGIFFPLGLGFMMILGQIDALTLILSIPFYGLILYMNKKKMLKDNHILLGTTANSSHAERKEFNKVLAFYRQLSFNLKRYPPEKAIILTSDDLIEGFSPNYSEFISKLKKYSIDYKTFFKLLVNDLHYVRSKILFQNLPVLLDYNSQNVSETMLDILSLIEKHLELQNERDVIYNAEKIKASLFSFVLPMILGFLSTVFLFFSKLSMDFTTNVNLFGIFTKISSFELFMYILSQIIMIFQVVLIFSEIFSLGSKIKMVLLSEMIYSFTLIITFLILMVVSTEFSLL